MAEKKNGRPAVGETRKISITLPTAEWKYIDKLIQDEIGPKSASAYFRLAHRHCRYDDPNGWGDRGVDSVMGPFTMAVLRAIEEHAGDFEHALQAALKMDAEHMARSEAARRSYEEARAADDE